MSTAADTLGDIEGLAKAIGFLDDAGNVRSDWLTRPSHYLSNVLADETQRDELIDFVDAVLGGEARETDPDGLVWLPIVAHDDPHVTLYVVLDPTPADYVAIGVGARLATAPTVSNTRVHVPIFRTAKAGHTVPDPILIGQSDAAVIRLDVEIDLGTAPPLGGIGLSLRVPTTAGPSPQLALSLKRLQLPGASAPRDLAISAAHLDELDEAALELVLGLARAQADAIGAGPLASLVGLLGLSESGGVPSLPLDRLSTQGVQALADWFEDVMADATARTAWLGQLASLVGGAMAGDEVALTIGAAQVQAGVRVTAGTGGATVVTPAIAASVTHGDVRLSVEADMLRLDLATRTAHALPRLSFYLQLGRRPDGAGTRLLTGDPQVDGVRVGISLNEARRPTFLLAADGVVIAGHTYPTLDLSSPGALAEVGGTVLSDVVSDLLAQLGPIGDTLRLLIGLTPPPSAPAAPTIELATLLQDPLAAVRAYWRSILRDHPAGVVDLLATVRDLIADNTEAGAAIAGAGTELDPWRMAIVGPVTLDVWRTGDVLEVSLSGRYVTDELGRRCTRVESRLTAGLVRVDLVAPSATFFSLVDASVTARARGSARAFITTGTLVISADHVGLAARWTPSTGMSVDVLAPNLAIEAGEIAVPFTLPVLQPDGSVAMSDEGWDGLELLLGLLASTTPVPWVQNVASALGWLPAANGDRPRLRLADLVVDPDTAIRSWIMALAVDDHNAVADALDGLARVLTGSSGAFGELYGRGTFEDPYRLPLLPAAKSPDLVAWLLPDGPSQPVTGSIDPIQVWQPGAPGLIPAALAHALEYEASRLPELADLLSGRPDLATGLAQLASRWTDTDGRIVPPVSVPPGVTVHRVADATAGALGGRVNLTHVLGAPPATVIRIAVGPDVASMPAERVVDVRAPGLAPESFAQPTAATGEWFIALAERPDARLASGDPDGVAGQAARLRRVLAPFSTVGNVVLVAECGAGHAAIAAANDLAFVSAVVTLGTPFGPVAFTILDDQPGADAFRLLQTLLPPLDPQQTDDPDLARGRGLVDALAALLPLGDPGRELRVPAAGPIAPRAGLAVHAVFGVVEQSLVLSAMTAIVAASISSRLSERGDRRPVNGARFGLRTNVAPGDSGMTISGHATVELFGVEVGSAGPEVSTTRSLLLHLELRRTGGWLVGGPGTGLGAGPRRSESLRWLEANIRVPLSTPGDDATAEFVLHEPRVFDIARERWVVRPDGLSSGGVDVVTPALPEVRVLVSMLVEQLELPSSSSPEVGAFLDLLRALNVVSPTGGAVPAAVDHLLHDPAAHLADALADATRRTSIAATLTTLLAGVPGISIDLASRRLVLDTGGSPGERGMLAWTAHVEATAGGTLTAHATVGSPGTTSAGGALMRLDTSPLRLTVEWHKPGSSPQTIALWPSPNAQALARLLVRLIPAEIARTAFEYLRALDDDSRPFLDAALDAIGLLAPETEGRRRVLLPAGLLEDPAGWFGHETALGSPTGFDATRVAALLDGLKPILGVAGGAGEWNLATGIKVIADSDSGHLRLGVSVDTSAFTPVAGATGRLAATGTFTLALPPDGAPRPAIAFSIGVAGATPGRRAVHVAVGDHVRVFLRPESGPDVSLYPDPPGLGQLADVALTRALPLVLDELARQSGSTLQGRVGEIVRTVGDGLGLRTGAPPRFDGARLQVWATDPAGELVAALPTLSATALTAMANAVTPAMPPGASVTAGGGVLTASVHGISVTWRPSPFEVTCAGTIEGIPGVGRAEVSIALDLTGLRSLAATIGPADIDAGGVMLRPYLSAVAGQEPAGGRRVEVGLALNAAATRIVAGRWHLGGPFTLIAADGATESTDPAQIATALLEAVLDLVASFVISTPVAQQLLANNVGATTVREVLRGVVLQDVPAPATLDANLFDAALLLGRLRTLAVHLAAAGPSIDVGGGLAIGLGINAGRVQLTLGVDGRIPLSSGDLVVSIEADSRWIEDRPDAGLAVGVLDTATMSFSPSLAANGVGIRIAKSSGPLLDAGLTLGSVAVHVFGAVAPGELSGGVQLQLSDLSVGLGGAQGGNPIASGLMNDANSGPDKLQPAFSPALAVQKHGGGPVLVSLSAGEGSGPWWLVIQKGFGPIYIEQVGFGVTVREDQIERISLLLDGRVSLFGLMAAVDDLQLTFVVASDASLFDPSRWAVDLAGLAINADLAGITLAGGLRKFGEGENVEYVGMLLARFAVYGLSVYGGYGSAVVDGERFAAFFAFGAINGPIGGPPAFFLTGIGGGLGINRDLILPSDLSRFDEFPFLKALDPAATPSSDPMAELASLRQYFPMRRGEFWFAAGISFTSFALVDGIAVVSVKIGDGLEIALLGLARMALPRPQVALVSIELGLLARFSTKEGVLWIQAQLTDNSWILHESVRLTGGFAFVAWFKGPNAGQFVLTMGGFHPRFHRDGYPSVPRLGFRWNVSSAIVVKGENYFALTSEAIMAGGEWKATARFGWAWADVVYGANGIVYFDPFRFEVEVYARISAGVTIDAWIGEITISVSLSARITITGPRFRAVAKFEVGPLDLTVAFGDTNQTPKVFLTWDQFVRKYLEEAPSGRARVLTAIPGKGAVPPGTRQGGTTETGTADGSAQKPFEVASEFELTVTTSVPTQRVRVAGAESLHLPSRALGIGPMDMSAANTRLDVRFTNDRNGADQLGVLFKEVNRTGAFPVGVWGPPQPDDDRKVPTGDVILAVDNVRFEARASLQNTLPGQVKYNQVETGPRKPLPFVTIQSARPALLTAARDLESLLPPAVGGSATFEVAKPWLALGGYSKTALAAIERERTAPPRLGSLTQGLAERELPHPRVELRPPAVVPPIDYRVRPPRAIAILSPPGLPERIAARTTVTDPPRGIEKITPPTLESVQAAFPAAVAARLVRLAPPAAQARTTVIGTGATPLTRAARGSVAAVAARGGFSDAQGRLDLLTATLASRRSRAPLAGQSSTLRAGEIGVLQMPNADRDIDPDAKRPRLMVAGASRVVVLAHGGGVLLDGPGSAEGTAIPMGAERVAVLAVGGETAADAASATPPPGYAGWHSGQELAYVGWATAIAAGCTVKAEGSSVQSTRQRFRAGWILGADLVDPATIASTRFAQPVRTVAVIIDDPAASDAARGLSLTLDGADRRSGPDGQPVPPVVVVVATRTVLIYSIVPRRGSRLAAGITIAIASQAGWHLAGVLAGMDPPGVMAQRLTEHGLDALVQPHVSGRSGDVKMGWSSDEPTPRAPRARRVEERGTASAATAARQTRRTPKRKKGA